MNRVLAFASLLSLFALSPYTQDAKPAAHHAPTAALTGMVEDVFLPHPAAAGQVKARGHATPVTAARPSVQTRNAPLLPSEAGHASLLVSKSGTDLLLDWYDVSAIGPFTATASENAAFSLNVYTLLQDTAYSGAYYTPSGAVSEFFDVCDTGKGEGSAATRGTPGAPPPGTPDVSAVVGTQNCLTGRGGSYIGDTVILQGNNFDLLSAANAIHFNGFSASLVNDPSNSDTSLKVTIPYGAAASVVEVCAHGQCSAPDYNADVLVVGPERGLTGISGVAFDASRDLLGAGERQWLSSNAGVYSVDPETLHGQAPAQAMALTSAVIPSMTFKDGAVVAASQSGGAASDYIYLLTRGATSGVNFGATHNAATGDCHGVTFVSTPQPSSLTLDATQLSSAGNNDVFLTDSLSGYIRRVGQGSLLTDTGAAKLDPSYGGYSPVGSWAVPAPILKFPFTGEVQAFSYYGENDGYRAATCTGQNILSLGSIGASGTHALTLNEKLNFGWYSINQATLGMSVSRERTSHYGYNAIAKSSYIFRGRPLDLYFDADTPQKVLISNLQGGAYPSAYQSLPREITFRVYARYPTVISGQQQYFYIRVVDPKDTSAYISGAPNSGKCAATPPNCDANGVPGQACDNQSWCDPTDNFGFVPKSGLACPDYTPPSGPTDPLVKYLCFPASASGTPITLRITGRHAGDNYRVEASLEDFIPVSVSSTSNYDPNYFVNNTSGIFTAWKRISVERDHMFRMGALLARDFDPTSCGTAGQPGCNVVEVFSWGGVDQLQLNDQVTLFQTDRPYEDAAAVNAKILNISSGFSANTKFITLSVNLKLSLNSGNGFFWYASSDNPAPPTNPAIDFSKGNSAALGVTSRGGLACRQLDTTNGPNACFYSTSTKKVADPFADAFVEYKYPEDGNGAVPFLPQSFFDNSGYLSNDAFRFHFAWFKNGQMVTGMTPPDDTPHNYFHLIGSIKAQNLVQGAPQYIGGYSSANADAIWLFIKTFEDKGIGVQATTEEEENACVHEFGHQFDLNKCLAIEDPHDTRKAWCDATLPGMSGCGPGFNSLICIMEPTDKLGPARFDLNDLLLGDPIVDPACTAPARLDTSIRTRTDPN